MSTFEHLPWPSTIRHAIFLDFDETLRPSDPVLHATAGIERLEALIPSLCLSHGVIVGWITGSNLDAVLAKARGYVYRFPHFIGSSLGTELHWLRRRRLQACPWWPSQIVHPDFCDPLLDRVAADLQHRGMVLTLQPQSYQGRYKRSYYGRGQGQDGSQYLDPHVRVLVQRCNPAAGDPAGAWDVDLIPTACGKDHLAGHIMERFGIDARDAFAIGDSMNDVPMLDSVGNPFLVANAEPSVRHVGYPVTRGAYCEGIIEALESPSLQRPPRGEAKRLVHLRGAHEGALRHGSQFRPQGVRRARRHRPRVPRNL